MTRSRPRVGAPSAIEALIPDPPWRTTATPHHASSEVTVLRHLPLDVPAARAVSVVQHLASLPVWERKARLVAVAPTGRAEGSYTAAGRIAGLVPWRATFHYQLTDAGFDSWMPTARMGIQVAGGFQIIDHDPRSCTVVHYEQYRLPLRSRPLARAWRIYVTRSMTAELQRVALLAAPELHQLDPWLQPALTPNHAG